jgi:hypothetical protein
MSKINRTKDKQRSTKHTHKTKVKNEKTPKLNSCSTYKNNHQFEEKQIYSPR